MRTQACRDKIHKTAKGCGLSPETVAEIDRVTGFVDEHPEAPQICGLTTDAIKPLMAISDPEKRQEAISLVEKSLNRKTPTGGTIKKRLTKPEVEKIIEKVSPALEPEFSGVATVVKHAAMFSAPVPDVKVTRKTVEALFEEIVPLMNKKCSEHIEQIRGDYPDLNLEGVFTKALSCLVQNTEKKDKSSKHPDKIITNPDGSQS
jgi:hypothetical protein